MKQENNILIADEGKYLKLKYNNFLNKNIELGNVFVFDGEKTILKNIDITDVLEVYPVFIDNNCYYISAKDYSNAVSELIRQKYSLDDELALIANSRLNINKDKEEEFQAWRVKCKEAAKKIFK